MGGHVGRTPQNPVQTGNYPRRENTKFQVIPASGAGNWSSCVLQWQRTC
jgi:hypothetical protein